ETDGQALGIAHRDPVMGSLTTNLALLRGDEQEVPTASVSLRLPQGIGRDEIGKRIGERVAAFGRRTQIGVEAETRIVTEPHLAAVDREPVPTLLAVWQEVTGGPGRPVAIGGATQASLFAGGVDFGPALDMRHYRGHGPDEYLTTAELRRIAELTLTAAFRLATAPPGD
ncbi:MAG: hypothetical protein M3O15_13525, partial [Acidobacteriota bacterium]|nr:hypothetical protein [Acidobacteriota bacterium]